LKVLTIIADDPTKLRIECLMLHHLSEAQVKSGEIGDGLNTLEQAERSPILVPILVGRYAVSEEKTDTYSVKGNNAEIRHDLARLARSSRGFSRCPYALHVPFACLSTTSASANYENISFQIALFSHYRFCSLTHLSTSLPFVTSSISSSTGMFRLFSQTDAIETKGRPLPGILLSG
jgi:hypothetical protein